MIALKTWIVRTRATVERIYEVEADNEKSALKASVNQRADFEECIQEETLSIAPAGDRG